jgi:dTDP-N-acetylfucosamine:lipid II N-acetylfucosaminyltransferase
MFLHLFDDEKFVDVAINLFETNRHFHQHQYIVILNTGIDKPTFVKSKLVQILFYDSPQLIELLKTSGNCQGIFIHYLSRKKAELIAYIPTNVKLIWMIWGGDAYPLIDNVLLLKSYFNQQKLIYSFFQTNKVKNAFYGSFLGFEKWKINRKKENKFILDVIPRFTHFSSVLINEEELFRKYLPIKNAIYLPFNYANILQLLGKFIDVKSNGKKILLGNSGDPSNQHIDILKKIKKDKRFLNVPLFVPLSYGYEKYIEHVEKMGNLWFSSNFVCVKKFMPLEEYTKLISECGICIMNHPRQQAVGNIISMIWMGSKVFLNEENLVFQFLNSIGVKVYSIQKDLFKSKENLFEELDENIFLNNRKALQAYFGEDQVNKRTYNLLYNLSLYP